MLPVLGHRTGADGLRWLHVRLPGRPNGHTGWIRQRATVASTTSWHIVVDTSRRRVIVYQNGRPVRTVKAVVGKPSTPTPRGEFFVEEAIQLRAADVGAPFALALSARSNVFQEFDGGPGQIALHGLANVGGVLGTAVSHGCVRLDNDTMRWLVVRIGPGVPVTITRVQRRSQGGSARSRSCPVRQGRRGRIRLSLQRGRFPRPGFRQR